MMKLVVQQAVITFPLSFHQARMLQSQVVIGVVMEQDLMALAVIFMVVWLSLIQTLYLIFNENSAQFATFITTMETCLQLILGKFDVSPIIKSSPILGSVFYIVYNIIIVFTLINIFITILIEHFNEAKLCTDLDRVDPDLISYLKFLFDGLFKSNSDTKSESKIEEPISQFSNKIEKLILKCDKVV